MKTSVQELILRRMRINYLKGKSGLVNSQQIQDVMHEITGHKHEYIGRELRKLAEKGKLKSEVLKIGNAKVASVYYQYIPDEKELLAFNYRNNEK